MNHAPMPGHFHGGGGREPWRGQHGQPVPLCACASACVPRKAQRKACAVQGAAWAVCVPVYVRYACVLAGSMAGPASCRPHGVSHVGMRMRVFVWLERIQQAGSQGRSQAR